MTYLEQKAITSANTSSAENESNKHLNKTTNFIKFSIIFNFIIYFILVVVSGMILHCIFYLLPDKIDISFKYYIFSLILIYILLVFGMFSIMLIKTNKLLSSYFKWKIKYFLYIHAFQSKDPLNNQKLLEILNLGN